MHGGEKLLSMDDDGFSDPYCIVAADKEKVRHITCTEVDLRFGLITVKQPDHFNMFIFLSGKDHPSRLRIC